MLGERGKTGYFALMTHGEECGVASINEKTVALVEGIAAEAERIETPCGELLAHRRLSCQQHNRQCERLFHRSLCHKSWCGTGLQPVRDDLGIAQPRPARVAEPPGTFIPKKTGAAFGCAALALSSDS